MMMGASTRRAVVVPTRRAARTGRTTGGCFAARARVADLAARASAWVRQPATGSTDISHLSSGACRPGIPPANWGIGKRATSETREGDHDEAEGGEVAGHDQHPFAAQGGAGIQLTLRCGETDYPERPCETQ